MGRSLICARVRCIGRCTTTPAHDLANAMAKGGRRDEEEGDGERRREEGEGGGGLVRRTHTGCTGVNYASREMSNCSPYRKIYNSALCGKHYVLSQSFLHPALPPDRPSFSHPMSPPSVHPLSRGPRALSSLFPTPARGDGGGGSHDSQINSRGTPQSY